MKAKKKAAQKKTTAKKSEAPKALLLDEPGSVITEAVAAAEEKTEAPFAAEAAIPKEPAPPTRKPISPEERRRLIQLAAYYRAERIGFGKTDPIENWLVAEREIDALVSTPSA